MFCIPVDRDYAKLNGMTFTDIAVLYDGGELIISAGRGEKAGASITLSPLDMIALGHACIATAHAAIDQQLSSAKIDKAWEQEPQL